MAAKSYSYPKYRKIKKSISELTKNFNSYKKRATQITLQQIYYEFQDKKDLPDWHL